MRGTARKDAPNAETSCVIAERRLLSGPYIVELVEAHQRVFVRCVLMVEFVLNRHVSFPNSGMYLPGDRSRASPSGCAPPFPAD